MPAERPVYSNCRLDPYATIETEIGRNEEEDPYHFGASLIDRIAATPGQEIGTHTFSHYYCLEAEPDLGAFNADLAAAGKTAALRGITLKSIVFPRNQVSEAHVAACACHGIVAYRGTSRGAVYKTGVATERAPLVGGDAISTASHRCSEPRPTASG